MRRIISAEDYAGWLTGFMPMIPMDGSGDWLPIGLVTDPTDGKLAHLDGLNISRAWMLEGMAYGLPAADPRKASLLGSAALHRHAGREHRALRSSDELQRVSRHVREPDGRHHCRPRSWAEGLLHQHRFQ